MRHSPGEGLTCRSHAFPGHGCHQCPFPTLARVWMPPMAPSPGLHPAGGQNIGGQRARWRQVPPSPPAPTCWCKAAGSPRTCLLRKWTQWESPRSHPPKRQRSSSQRLTPPPGSPPASNEGWLFKDADWDPASTPQGGRWGWSMHWKSHRPGANIPAWDLPGQVAWSCSWAEHFSEQSGTRILVSPYIFAMNRVKIQRMSTLQVPMGSSQAVARPHTLHSAT